MRQLRDVYRQLDIDEEGWPISTGPGQPRNPAHEPHINGLIAMRTEIFQHMSEANAGSSARDVLTANELWIGFPLYNRSIVLRHFHRKGWVQE